MNKIIVFLLVVISFSSCIEAEGVNGYKQVCDLYEVAAKEEAASSQYLLGVCFQFGRGREKNIKQALHWFGRASENDYKPAIESLNTIRLFDLKDKKKHQLALLSLKELLNESYGRAGVVLAVAYHNGINVDENNEQSIGYLRKAAKLNVPEAIAGMYYIYKYGLLDEKINLDKSKLWFDKLNDYVMNSSLLNNSASDYFAKFKKSDFLKLLSKGES